MSSILPIFGLSLLGITAGVSFVLQSAVNSQLRGILGSASWASFFSYLGGTITFLVVLTVLREPFFPFGKVSHQPWWVWTGGIFGAVYVVALILLLPRLGAGTAVALIVAGQMLASLIIDHYGYFGLQVHSVSLTRLCGSALLILGVALIRN